MKKFLSVLLLLSLLMCAATKSLADEDNDTVEALFIKNKLLEDNSYFNMFPLLFKGSSVMWNQTQGFTKKIINGVEQFGQLGFRLSGINHGLTAFMSLYLATKGLYDKIKLRASKINQNVDTVNEAFDKELQCIKGQEKAKKRMKELVASIIDARNEANENNKPYGKGDVIYMIGPSGVGKTFSAECLARAIMGSKAQPIRIDSSCFEKESTTSVKSQILYMREQQKNTSASNYYYVDNSIAAQIASNPKTVLMFDEYDKWCTPDTDEFLRAIMDKGIIYRDGEKIDCSGILVIVISNEDIYSVTFGNNCPAFEDDGTGSRTRVVHDKSFLNRLNIIEFENLNEDAYEQIAQNQLEIIANRYRSLFSIDLEFGDTARKIAIATARRNQGAREIEKILASLKMAIISARQDIQKSLGLFKRKLFKVDYNYNNDAFTLKENKDNTDESKEDLLLKNKDNVKNENTALQPQRQELNILPEENINEDFLIQNFDLNEEKTDKIENVVEKEDFSQTIDIDNYTLENNTVNKKVKTI